MKVSELEKLEKGTMLYWFSELTPYPDRLICNQFWSMGYHGESFIDVTLGVNESHLTNTHRMQIEDDGSIGLFATKIDALEYQLKETVDNIIRPIRYQIRKLRGEKKVNLTKEMVYEAFKLFNIDLKSESYDGDECACPPHEYEQYCTRKSDNIQDCKRCIDDFLNKRLAENV